MARKARTSAIEDSGSFTVVNFCNQWYDTTTSVEKFLLGKIPEGICFQTVFQCSIESYSFANTIVNQPSLWSFPTSRDPHWQSTICARLAPALAPSLGPNLLLLDQPFHSYSLRRYSRSAITSLKRLTLRETYSCAVRPVQEVSRLPYFQSICLTFLLTCREIVFTLHLEYRIYWKICRVGKARPPVTCYICYALSR